MIGFVRDFLKGLFAFYLGAVLVTPFILLIAFHKPWWAILLYVPAVLFLVGRVQLEIEQIKVKRETTVIMVGREMILNGLRTEDESKKFIKTFREYIDSSREAKYWRKVPLRDILGGKVEYNRRKISKAEDDYRNATAYFNESLGFIAKRTPSKPKGKAFPTVWTKLLAGLLNACGFRTYRNRILLSAFKEYFDKYILDDETTAEDIDELITAWRNDWDHRQTVRLGNRGEIEGHKP